MDDFEVYGDQPGDYDIGTKANYGDITKLFDYDFSNLFDSFGGVDLSSITDSLGSLKSDVNLADLLSKDTVGFGTQYGLNPSQSRDLYEGINLEKLSDVGELNDLSAAGKVTAEEAVRSGNPLLAGTIITPQEALDFGIDVNTLLPVASDITSPAMAKLLSDFGLSSSGAASGIVDPFTAKLVNETNKLVTGSPELSKTGVIYPGSGGNGAINKTETVNKVQEIIRNLTGGKDNAALLAALLGGLLGLAKKSGGVGAGRVTGYQGGQGKPLTATRQALSPTGAPGAGGKRFMTDVTYAAEGGLMDIVSGQPNQNVTFMAEGGIADYMDMGKGMNVGDLRRADYLVRTGMAPDDAGKYYSQVPEGMARGGISDLGSYSDGGRMLKGPGDGMSDSIPATIGGKRQARLADGEFVVPADVVSHLGNGSTDAGADVLYDMMNKVRKARTGTQKQGKQINPGKFVPRN